jgi:polyhydroxyalkanoate synthesis regulator phasin
MGKKKDKSDDTGVSVEFPPGEDVMIIKTKKNPNDKRTEKEATIDLLNAFREVGVPEEEHLHITFTLGEFEQARADIKRQIDDQKEQGKLTPESATQLYDSLIKMVEAEKKFLDSEMGKAILNLLRKTELRRRDKELQPYINMKGSLEMDGIVRAILTPPNTENEIDGKICPCTETEITTKNGIKFKTIIAWKEGALISEGRKLFLYALSNNKKGKPYIEFNIGDYHDERELDYVYGSIDTYNQELVKIKGMEFGLERNGRRIMGRFFGITDEPITKNISYKNNYVRLYPSDVGRSILSTARADWNISRKNFPINENDYRYAGKLLWLFDRDMDLNWGYECVGKFEIEQLLKDANMPPYKKHPKTDDKRSTTPKQDYVIPFENNMNHLSEIGVITWKYTNGGGETWKSFIKGSIQVWLTQHPRKGQSRADLPQPTPKKTTAKKRPKKK